MSTLIVPKLDEQPWPTLGPQIAAFIEERAIFGPGSLKGQPARLDADKKAALYRLYEVYPQGHPLQGMRRFKRGSISWRKGLAKTEFMAWVAFAELHPEGPVRCDGFDAHGRPVGRPVNDPYIPMLAVTAEQVEELAFGALSVICAEGPDAEFFDVSLERIIRLDEYGHADGKAVPLSNNPGARDGARTTFQCFDEPHRLYLPRAKSAHETMVANLEKRALEDPWGLYVGTAGELGQESIAEGIHEEALAIERGEIDDPQLFHFHREAGGTYDMSQREQVIEAVREATGPVGEYGPGQFESIAKQWERPSADKAMLERLWLNRWVRSGQQAFDPNAWAANGLPGSIPDGALVTAGFDGARYRDSTAIVITEVSSGRQELWALWERPADVDEWELPLDELRESMAYLFEVMDVWRLYCDPFFLEETVAAWRGRWPKKVYEWRTNVASTVVHAVRAYREAIASGEVHWSQGDPQAADLARHIGAAGRRRTNFVDDDGQPMFMLQKIHPDRKFDAAMAGLLSWEARRDAISSGVTRSRSSKMLVF